MPPAPPIPLPPPPAFQEAPKRPQRSEFRPPFPRRALLSLRRRCAQWQLRRRASCLAVPRAQLAHAARRAANRGRPALGLSGNCGVPTRTYSQGLHVHVQGRTRTSSASRGMKSMCVSPAPCIPILQRAPAAADAHHPAAAEHAGGTRTALWPQPTASGMPCAACVRVCVCECVCVCVCVRVCVRVCTHRPRDVQHVARARDRELVAERRQPREVDIPAAAAAQGLALPCLARTIDRFRGETGRVRSALLAARLRP
jgi:hypothetical protein